MALLAGDAGIRLGVLSISTRGARGERDDASGEAVRELLPAPEYRLERYELVPDDAERIRDTLLRWCDEERLHLVVTTGGTGLTSRDVTPEATRDVIRREVPGMAEAMRVETLRHTPMAMLSRALAGVRGRTLVINLPGSPGGVRQCLEVVRPALGHAVETMHDKPLPVHHPH